MLVLHKDMDVFVGLENGIIPALRVGGECTPIYFVYFTRNGNSWKVNIKNGIFLWARHPGLHNIMPVMLTWLRVYVVV